MNAITEPVLSTDRSALTRHDVLAASTLFLNMSHPARIAVLIRIIEREWTVTEMASDLKLSQSALSQHLSKLRQAKMVTVRRFRQERFYKCINPLVIRLIEDVIPRG